LNAILRVKATKESNLLQKYFTVLDDIELYLEKNKHTDECKNIRIQRLFNLKSWTTR